MQDRLVFGHQAWECLVLVQVGYLIRNKVISHPRKRCWNRLVHRYEKGINRKSSTAFPTTFGSFSGSSFKTDNKSTSSFAALLKSAENEEEEEQGEHKPQVEFKPVITLEPQVVVTGEEDEITLCTVCLAS
jgi:hypothetical protein